MSIAKLGKAKQEERPVLVIDLEPWIAEPGELRFREPRAADLFVRDDVSRELRIDYAEFPIDLIRQVYVLGKCYIPDGTEGQTYSPIRAFADLARDNRHLFLHIVGEFAQAFPVLDIAAIKDQAKNAPSA